MSIEGWMDKQNMSYNPEEYYSALKKKEILTYDATWMKLEGIMLSETNQSQKGKYSSIHMSYLE